MKVHMVYTAVFVESIVYRELNGLKLSVGVSAEILHSDPDPRRQKLMCQTKHKASITHTHTHTHTHTLDLWIHIQNRPSHIYTQCTWGRGAVCQLSIFLSKPDSEAEKQQTAERVGSVITADTISGSWLPWYPATTGYLLIGWRALVSQKPVLLH